MHNLHLQNITEQEPMPESTQDRRRTTITLGRALRALLADGSVAGESTSARIDQLAERYSAVMRSQVPKRLSVADWQVLIDVASSMTIARPADVIAIGIRLRQASKERAGTGGTDLGQLAYRFEALSLVEQLSVLDVIERAVTAGAAPGANLHAWLVEQGIAVV